MSAWNDKVIEEFRANDGKVGGQFEGAPLVLLHTKGAKSGIDRVSPMMYLDYEDRLFVFASKAGADTDPDWYRNLVADPTVVIELGTESFGGTAKPLGEQERARIFAVQAGLFPGFTDYQAKTTRVIPVVELVRS